MYSQQSPKDHSGEVETFAPLQGGAVQLQWLKVGGRPPAVLQWRLLQSAVCSEAARPQPAPVYPGLLPPVPGPPTSSSWWEVAAVKNLIMRSYSMFKDNGQNQF